VRGLLRLRFASAVRHTDGGLSIRGNEAARTIHNGRGTRSVVAGNTRPYL
jgi:hypothetical protein